MPSTPPASEAPVDRFSLPPPVTAAIDDPAPGRSMSVRAADRDWHALEWGGTSGPPVLLVHGVTSDGGTFWRVGPAIAATGRHVVAVDLPGHGRTGQWRGHHRFVETATEVRAFVMAAGLAPSGGPASSGGTAPDLAVVGHSWGAMVAAWLPATGLVPGVLVLLDPPALTLDQLELMTHDPEEQPPTGPDEAHELTARLRRLHPDWVEGDIRAKVDGLLRFDPEAVRAVLLENGDWDAGVAALGEAAAARVPAWYIRGEWSAGGLIPDARLPACAGRVGRDHVITIPGAPHSPQRTHIEATIAAILRALGEPGQPSAEPSQPPAG